MAAQVHLNRQDEMPNDHQNQVPSFAEHEASRRALEARGQRGRPLVEVFAAEQEALNHIPSVPPAVIGATVSHSDTIGPVGGVVGHSGGSVGFYGAMPTPHDQWQAGLREEMNRHTARLAEIEGLDTSDDEFDRLMNRNAFIRAMLGDAPAPPRQGSEPVVTTGYSRVTHGENSPLSEVALLAMVRNGDAIARRNNTLYRTDFFQNSRHGALLGWVNDDGEPDCAVTTDGIDPEQALQNADDAQADISRAAAIMGRKGGLRGGPARAAALSPERRREIARNAGLASQARLRAARLPTAPPANSSRTLTSVCLRCATTIGGDTYAAYLAAGESEHTLSNGPCANCGRSHLLNIRRCAIPTAPPSPPPDVNPTYVLSNVCLPCAARAGSRIFAAYHEAVNHAAPGTPCFYCNQSGADLGIFQCQIPTDQQ